MNKRHIKTDDDLSEKKLKLDPDIVNKSFNNEKSDGKTIAITSDNNDLKQRTSSKETRENKKVRVHQTEFDKNKPRISIKQLDNGEAIIIKKDEGSGKEKRADILETSALESTESQIDYKRKFL